MVEETYLPVKLSVPEMTDERFQELCDQYDDYFLEYTAEGELLIKAPADPERVPATWRFHFSSSCGHAVSGEAW